MPTSTRLPLVFWIVLLVWTAYALVFASQVVSMGEQQGQAITWSEALKFSFGGWMTWIPLSLGLYALAAWRPIERGHVLPALALLTTGALLVVVLRAGYVSLTNPLFGWYGDAPLPPFTRVLATSFFNNFLLAWLVIGVAHAMVFYQQSRERGRQVAALQASLTSTRLDALRAQLNPHFLFNALNSVAEMVHRDAEQADRMLMALSAMLRDSLSSDQHQLRPLRDELALVDHYLMIEKIRLGDRLQVQRDIAPDCLDVLMPALLLQPLVENAIVHGIAPSRTPGRLSIRVQPQGDGLRLDVENSIAGSGTPTAGTGIGLHSTRSRLHLLYGDDAQLTVDTRDMDTHVVRLCIPAAAIA
jgi:signal transduction histidine kinase